MNAAYQLVGAVAIVVGLLGTWLAARHAGGWLLCIGSTVLWFPALVTGEQWAAVANCGLSICICLRNFRVGVEPDPGEASSDADGVPDRLDLEQRRHARGAGIGRPVVAARGEHTLEVA